MPFIILMAVMGVPILEIIGFVYVGGWLGAAPTIGLVLLAVFFGLMVVRNQGVATLLAAQAAFARGETPIREVFDGACLMLAGILLLIPGFFSDVFAFLLLTPPVRVFLRARLGALSATQGGRGGSSGVIIEGEFKDLTNKRGDKIT
ncbi:MAG: hypothetical protein A2516_07825 [Alphaproteobacteria bacterium RIFOXYD12_FULL_60_8]|nr:MAG: hypothetical protein A2516_07825 [Alphaproteobacteria bacterium RIFOXYD12_FULL_60_8]